MVSSVRLLLAAAAWLALAAQLAAVDAAEPDDLKTVLETWQRREAAAKSLKLVWTETQTTETDGLSLPDPELQARLREQETILHATRNSALFDGRRVRIEEEAAEEPDESEQEERRIMVFDGALGKALTYRPSLNYPQGGITEQQLPNQNIAKYLPLLLTYRLLDEHLGLFGPKDLVLTDERATIEGRECRILETAGTKKSRSRRRLWIDPERDFVVVRYERDKSGVVRSRIDITHAHDERFGWVPTGWEIHTLKPNGSVQTSIVGDVQECTLQPEIAEADFELEFPVGTRYFDHRAGAKTLIVQAPDKSREFFPAEISRGATQEDLLTTEPGKAKLEAPPRAGWKNGLLWGNIAVLALLGIWLIVRRFLRRRSS